MNNVAPAVYERTGHFNQLTPAVQERLVLLGEECNEAAMAVAKILRHGFQSNFHGKLQYDNREQLEKELGHVLHAIRRLWQNHDVSDSAIEAAALEKEREIIRYLHHQAVKEPGYAHPEGTRSAEG